MDKFKVGDIVNKTDSEIFAGIDFEVAELQIPREGSTMVRIIPVDKEKAHINLVTDMSGLVLSPNNTSLYHQHGTN